MPGGGMPYGAGVMPGGPSAGGPDATGAAAASGAASAAAAPGGPPLPGTGSPGFMPSGMPAEPKMSQAGSPRPSLDAGTLHSVGSVQPSVGSAAGSCASAGRQAVPSSALCGSNHAGPELGHWRPRQQQPGAAAQPCKPACAPRTLPCPARLILISRVTREE